MSEHADLSVIWTPNAIETSDQIKDYLLWKFTEREVTNFYELLFSFEQRVVIFPELYPFSPENPDIRRAVLSKPLSVFYSKIADKIFILAVLDNRMSKTNWP